MTQQLLAITVGDIAGIGPEVIVRSMSSAGFPAHAVPILIGPPEIFLRAAELIDCRLQFQLLEAKSGDPAHFRERVRWIREAGCVPICNPAESSALQAPQCQVSAAAGDAAFRCLCLAIDLTLAGCTDAIVTAPLNKESLHLAGHNFPGHTEILAQRCGVREFAMMLHLPEPALQPVRQLLRRAAGLVEIAPVAGLHGLSIAHTTLHTSVASVPSLLTTTGIVEKIDLLDAFLRRAGSLRRSIAVSALNPHGGEHGLFGNEESAVIAPAVSLRQERCNVQGPLPVDTLIRRAVLGEFDGVVAMYHDQGHIPVKLLGFDAAINITLGLPVIRTSPTHGTAFDRAWNRRTPASEAGMLESIRMACQLAFSRADVH